MSSENCAVCGGPTDSIADYRCTSCCLVVHCGCFQTDTDHRTSWLCVNCKEKKSQKCRFCPVSAAKTLLVKRAKGDVTFHLICALFSADAVLANGATVKSLYERLPSVPGKHELTCCVCSGGQRACKQTATSGLVRRCQYETCQLSYHIPCAWSANLLFAEDSPAGLVWSVYCSQHFTTASKSQQALPLSSLRAGLKPLLEANSVSSYLNSSPIENGRPASGGPALGPSSTAAPADPQHQPANSTQPDKPNETAQQLHQTGSPTPMEVDASDQRPADRQPADRQPADQPIDSAGKSVEPPNSSCVPAKAVNVDNVNADHVKADHVSTAALNGGAAAGKSQAQTVTVNGKLVTKGLGKRGPKKKTDAQKMGNPKRARKRDGSVPGPLLGSSDPTDRPPAANSLLGRRSQLSELSLRQANSIEAVWGAFVGNDAAEQALKSVASSLATGKSYRLVDGVVELQKTSCQSLIIDHEIARLTQLLNTVSDENKRLKMILNNQSSQSYLASSSQSVISTSTTQVSAATQQASIKAEPVPTSSSSSATNQQQVAAVAGAQQTVTAVPGQSPPTVAILAHKLTTQLSPSSAPLIGIRSEDAQVLLNNQSGQQTLNAILSPSIVAALQRQDQSAQSQLLSPVGLQVVQAAVSGPAVSGPTVAVSSSASTLAVDNSAGKQAVKQTVKKRRPRPTNGDQPAKRGRPPKNSLSTTQPKAPQTQPQINPSAVPMVQTQAQINSPPAAALPMQVPMQMPMQQQVVSSVTSSQPVPTVTVPMVSGPVASAGVVSAGNTSVPDIGLPSVSLSDNRPIAVPPKKRHSSGKSSTQVSPAANLTGVATTGPVDPALPPSSQLTGATTISAPISAQPVSNGRGQPKSPRRTSASDLVRDMIQRVAAEACSQAVPPQVSVSLPAGASPLMNGPQKTTVQSALTSSLETAATASSLTSPLAHGNAAQWSPATQSSTVASSSCSQLPVISSPQNCAGSAVNFGSDGPAKSAPMAPPCVSIAGVPMPFSALTAATAAVAISSQQQFLGPLGVSSSITVRANGAANELIQPPVPSSLQMQAQPRISLALNPNAHHTNSSSLGVGQSTSSAPRCFESIIDTALTGSKGPATDYMGAAGFSVGAGAAVGVPPKSAVVSNAATASTSASSLPANMATIQACYPTASMAVPPPQQQHQQQQQQQQQQQLQQHLHQQQQFLALSASRPSQPTASWALGYAPTGLPTPNFSAVSNAFGFVPVVNSSVGAAVNSSSFGGPQMVGGAVPASCISSSGPPSSA